MMTPNKKPISLWICILLIGMLIFQLDCSSFSLGKPMVLTLKGAMDQAYKVDPELVALKKERDLRALELKTLEGQVDALRKLQGAIRLTLYPKRLIEESNASLKELQLFLDLEKAKSMVVDLDSQWASRVADLEYRLKVLFYNLLEKESAIAYEKQQLLQLEQLYPVQYKNYLNGMVPKATLEMTQTKTKATKERLFKAESEAEAIRPLLAAALGEKDLNKWVLDPNVVALHVNGLKLETASTHALKFHRQLFLSERDKMKAELAVDSLLYFLKAEYGELSQPLTQLLTAQKAPYNDVFEAYLKLMAATPSAVAETYPVRMGFYAIDAPMKSLRSDWPGTVYMKDQRYPLMAALTDRDQRTTAYNNTQKQLVEDLKAQWLGILQTQYDLESLNQTIALEKLRGEKLLKDSLTGKVPYRLAQASKELELESIQKAFLMQIKLNRQIETFDYGSAGGLSIQKIPPGESASTATKKGISWQLETSKDKIGFEWRLTWAEPSLATHYQLFDGNGVSIGGMKAIGEGLSAPGLKPQGKIDLSLVLYQKDKVLGTYLIPGDADQGELKLK